MYSGVTLASPITSTIEVIEYQDGDDLILHKRPGRAKVGNFSIKGTSPISSTLVRWLNDTKAGKLSRKSVSYSKNGVTHTCFEVFPCGLEANADGSWVMTLAFERHSIALSR